MNIPSKQAVATIIVLSEIVERAIAASNRDELSLTQLSAIANNCLYDYYKHDGCIQEPLDTIYTGMSFQAILENAIVEHVAHGCIPERLPNPGTMLSDKVDLIGLANSVIESNESYADAIRRWTNEIYEDVSEVFDEIAMSASTISKKLTVALETLAAIKKEVSELVAKINEKIEATLSTDTMCTLHKEMDPNTASFNEYDASIAINHLGGVSAIRTLCNNISGVTSDDNQRRAYVKVGSRMLTRLGEIPNIEPMSNDTIAEIISQIHESDVNISDESIRESIKIMYSPVKLKSIGKTIVGIMESGVVFADILEITRFIETHWLTVGYINNSKYKNNVSEYMWALLNMAGYYITHVNDTTLADTYLIGDSTINVANKQRAKEANITDEYLFRYVFVNKQHGVDMSSSMTSISSLSDKRDDILKKWNDLEYAITIKASDRKRAIKLSVVRSTVLSYLEADDYNTDNALRYIDDIKKMERALDYVVYDAIMASRYPERSLITELYEKLGVAYTRLLEKYPDKIDSLKDNTTVGAIARAVMDKLVDAFI